MTRGTRSPLSVSVVSLKEGSNPLQEGPPSWPLTSPGVRGFVMPRTFTGENRPFRAWPLAHLTSTLRFSGKTLKTALQSESVGQRHKPGQPKGSMERDEILARLRERIVAFAAALANPGDNPGTALERKEMLEQVIAAITWLSLRCRQLFRWKLQGKSFSVSQTATGLDGRVLGRNGCARRTRAGGLSLAPLERGA